MSLSKKYIEMLSCDFKSRISFYPIHFMTWEPDNNRPDLISESKSPEIFYS